MVRIAAILLAFTVCVLAGAGRAARLTRRYTALSRLLTAGERVLARVAATHEPLYAALAKETDSEVFARFARGVLDGKPAAEAVKAALQPVDTVLTETDKAAVTELLYAFSAVSVRQVEERFTKAAARVSVCAGEAEHDQRDKAKLYRAMGVLFGAALAILLW